MNDTPDPVAEPGLEPAATPPRPAAYRVLARKYRPASFDDLIGQEAMVRTVSNAFETGRIPQAWILTGVRGVGKTTTARILARALNYELPDGSITGPTIHDAGARRALPGDHGKPAYRRDRDGRRLPHRRRRHPPDQRRGALRAGVSARYKVYIIDEVHMLSTAAFNALLKTLEEPPPHAKFIFATTEIRKVPVTVLSRCQRFDLRRVDAGVLVGASRRHRRQGRHRGRAGGAGADRPRRRRLGARCAVAARSGDRACRRLGARRGRAADAGPRRPHARHRPVRGADARRHRRGAQGTARAVRHRRRSGRGADRPRRVHPFRHPREDRAGGRRRPLARPRSSARAGARFAAKLSMRVLSRTWQMLLKGIAEVQSAGTPDRGRRNGAGAHRLCGRSADARRGRSAALDRRRWHPGGARRSEHGGGGATAGQRPSMARMRRAARRRRARPRRRCDAGAAGAPSLSRARRGRSRSAPRSRSARFEDLVALAAREARPADASIALERDVRLVRFEDGRLEIALRAERRRRRWSTICRASSRNGPAGAGWSWSRPNRASRRSRSQNEARQRRTRDRRAGRSAGAGGAGAVSRRRDRRRAQRT